jgi:hypothetical protein
MNSQEHSSHLTKQFELLWKHLEYHDSNIFKIMSIYFAFSGLFVAKINLFENAPILASILVAIVSVIFSLLLIRTSSLLTEFKKKIQEIDEIMTEQYGANIIKSIPDNYIESKLRTSQISAITIPIFALIVIFNLTRSLNVY